MKKPMPKSKSLSGFEYARVAAALGKSYAAKRIEPEEIAADAIRLDDLGKSAVEAVMRQMPADKMALEARKIARRYNAEVVDERDLNGIVLGLRFLDGSYADMDRHIFKIC